MAATRLLGASKPRHTYFEQSYPNCGQQNIVGYKCKKFTYTKCGYVERKLNDK